MKNTKIKIISYALDFEKKYQFYTKNRYRKNLILRNKRKSIAKKSLLIDQVLRDNNIMDIFLRKGSGKIRKYHHCQYKY